MNGLPLPSTNFCAGGGVGRPGRTSPVRISAMLVPYAPDV